MKLFFILSLVKLTFMCIPTVVAKPTNGFASQNITQTFVLAILDNLGFNVEAELCTLLRVHSPEAGQDVDIQTRQVGMESGRADNTELTKEMQRNDICVVAVFSGADKLEDIIEVTRLVKKHLNVYYDSQIPSEGVLSRLNRPFLWIRQAQQNHKTFEFTMFCPRLGKPRKYQRVRLGGYGQNIGWTTYSTIESACPNPFLDQHVTIAELPVLNRFLRPPTFDIPKVSGVGAEMYGLFAERLGFKLTLRFMPSGKFFPNNRTFGPGRFRELQEGDSPIGTIGQLLVYAPLFDLGTYFWQTRVLFYTRNPQPISSYGQILTPFPNIVWIATLSLNLALATFLLFIYKLYKEKATGTYQLYQNEEHLTNFYLFPFAKITEPEPLPWFLKSWSTGKFVSFLWCIFSMMMIMFYNSNLRAHLVMIDYEEAPDTLRHVIERGTTVYSYTSHGLSKEFLASVGEADSDVYKAIDQSEKTGGRFDFAKTRMRLPKEAPKDLLENGAFIMSEDPAIPYFYKQYPLLRSERLYIVNEPMNKYFPCYGFKKNSPATAWVDDLTRTAVETGLVNKWYYVHLPMRAILKPKQDQVQLKPMELSSFYTSFMFYTAGMIVAILTFVIEIYPKRYDWQMD